MFAGSARIKPEHWIGILAAALVLAAIIADFNVQQHLDLFGGEVIRWIVFILGVVTLGMLARIVSSRPRLDRAPHYYVSAWLVGLATIIGLVQTLPSPPTLETVQAVDFRSLDPFAQAALQWGAGWTALVLLTFVFTGPRLSLGWGIVVWLIGVVSTVVVASTLPEETLPPLILLPISAVWAAIVYIATVYSPATAPVDDGGGAVSGLPVTRAVWASLALVLLGLVLAEFESFVALDQQVNADRTVTQRAMDGVATGIDNIDQNTTATAKALRAHGDVKGSIETLQSSITDVGDEVVLVQEAQQLSTDANMPRAAQAKVLVDRVVKANDGLQALLIPLGTVNLDTDRDQLMMLLDRDVPRAVAGARRETHLAQQVLVGNELPTAGVFLWVAAIYAALVLLPWVLFVLFLLQKRESRARESLIDLCLLDGRPAPPRASDAPFGEIQPGSLLDRVLGEGFLQKQRPASGGSNATVGQVQGALVERAFSEPEYLIGLTLLSGIVAAGWYMVFYPKGGVGLAETIIQGADSAHLWAYLLSGLNPLTAAFAGAYFWCIYALVRRYLDSDLYPAAFLQCAVQFVLALVLSLMIAIAFPPVALLAQNVIGFVGDTASSVGNRVSGAATANVGAALANGSAAATGPVPPTTVEAITMLLAFIGGVSISAGFTQVLSLLRVLLRAISLRSEQPLMNQPGLTELEGIDSWTEARFAEEGVDNIQALANAPLQRLVLRTHFTTQRLVDWVDQALLYVHTANWPTEPVDASIERDDKAQTAQTPSDGRTDLFRALRFAGIRTATDLLGAGGWLKMATYVDLGDALTRQQTLQQALGRVLDNNPAFGAALFTACQALIEAPNWVHVANFRRAGRDQLGADTRAWIQPVSPRPIVETPALANGVAAPVVAPSAGVPPAVRG